MATITKGILGGISGTIGTVVGANFRGKDILRSRPKKSSKLPTEKQLLQQAKFKLVVQFMQPLKFIQSRYFGQNSGAKSRVNLAVSYMLDNAISVVLGVPELLYNKVLITKGDLAGFQNLTAAPVAGQKIEFNWVDNSLQGNASADDIVNVVCYSEDLGNFEIFQNIAVRGDLSAEMTLPLSYQAKAVSVWVYFNNTKENLACNSNYVGLLTIL
ncbi:DUF6266 family protein [Halpernia frigidisoli]|uniref:Uncharacterized protein n=1 Tax=Halpernia frigidisoli TaxID=1125876 RepID=A0A1I3DM91_9FLAO|nr:DUF6266 family protein [Halpernia frigidisoli]SFH87816.1 hypothetical protein SAMN05443292_0573 [Halpernia frigidisoli]